jgi:hypothetical protein
MFFLQRRSALNRLTRCEDVPRYIDVSEWELHASSRRGRRYIARSYGCPYDLLEVAAYVEEFHVIYIPDCRFRKG